MLTLLMNSENKSLVGTIIAVILLSITFIFIIGVPILSFIGVLPTTSSVTIEEIPESMQLLSEILILIIQLAIIIGLLVIIPFIWYFLVNGYSLKQIFSKIKLTLERIDEAFLWGILAVILMYVISFVLVGLFITILGEEETSNIQDLEYYFSPVTLVILITVQPIAEEIFFRGFLMDKIDSFAGKNIAIFSTAILFGLAHMSYGKIFPVILPIAMGIILGYIVYKTKNLYSAIIAHILFNLSSFILYYFAKSLV
jgi:membrane protease YdiL (CAAX protease family)